MSNKLFQLVGLDANQGLYEVPDGLDVQEAFNEAFDNQAVDFELSEVDDCLKEKFNIKRAWIEEVFTDKL